MIFNPLDQTHPDLEYLTMQFHTTQHRFDTRPGLNITEGLYHLFDKYNLGKVWGKSPQDYTLYRDPVTSNRSILKFFAEEAVPTALSNVPSVAPARYFVIGTGVIRYDIFKGDFNQNDQLTASSYPDQFWCIPNVLLGAAKATAQKMNENAKGSAHSFASSEPRHAWRSDAAEVDEIRLRWLAEMNGRATLESQGTQQLTLGYVTQDVSFPLPLRPPSNHTVLLIKMGLPLTGMRHAETRRRRRYAPPPIRRVP